MYSNRDCETPFCVLYYFLPLWLFTTTKGFIYAHLLDHQDRRTPIMDVWSRCRSYSRYRVCFLWCPSFSCAGINTTDYCDTHTCIHTACSDQPSGSVLASNTLDVGTELEAVLLVRQLCVYWYLCTYLASEQIRLQCASYLSGNPSRRVVVDGRSLQITIQDVYFLITHIAVTSPPNQQSSLQHRPIPAPTSPPGAAPARRNQPTTARPAAPVHGSPRTDPNAGPCAAHTRGRSRPPRPSPRPNTSTRTGASCPSLPWVSVCACVCGCVGGCELLTGRDPARGPDVPVLDPARLRDPVDVRPGLQRPLPQRLVRGGSAAVEQAGFCERDGAVADAEEELQLRVPRADEVLHGAVVRVFLSAHAEAPGD